MTGPNRTALVVGIGNPDRGDDGVGAAVATAVASHRLAGVSVKHLREPVALLDEEPDYDLVIVVDAVLSRAEPGSVSVREVDEHPLPDWAGTGGTHTVSYNGVPCTLRNAKSGQYGGVRNFWMITRGAATGVGAQIAFGA